jgi:hypothetical protein
MIPAFLFSEGSEVRRTRMVSAAHLAPFHFYRLVEKTERAYERLAGHLVSARKIGPYRLGCNSGRRHDKGHRINLIERRFTLAHVNGKMR